LRAGLLSRHVQRDKPSNKPPAGLLQPLPIPARMWDRVSLDLIVELPPIAQGYNVIVVFIDALSKMVHLAPTTTTATAVDTAQLFLERVVCLHGLPMQIVADRDPQFAGLFWNELMRLMGTKCSLSTAFHRRQVGRLSEPIVVLRKC
jgi:hypothetical protein